VQAKILNQIFCPKLYILEIISINTMSLTSLLILVLLGAIALGIILGFAKKIARTVICVVVIALVILGGYQLWKVFL